MPYPAPTRSKSSIKFATIHHSADTPAAKNLPELIKKASKYDAYHATKSFAIYTDGRFGYRFISYHWLIAKNGAVLQVQDPKFVRYHASDNVRGAMSHNRYGIAILLEGNFQVETPTDPQLKAAAKIINDWQRKNHTKLTVKGHRETAIPVLATLCPGANMGLSYRPTSRLARIIRLAHAK